MADDILTFKTPPFSADGSAKFLYLDAPRRRILADLIAHVCDGQGPILLVAEPGMGKTTLIDRLADEATAHNIRVVFSLTDIAAIANTTEADSQPPTAFLLDDGSSIPLGVWHQLVALLRSASPTAPGTPSKRLPPIVIALTPDLLDWLVEASLVPRNAPLDRVFRLPPFAPRDVGRFISLGLRVAGVDRPEVFTAEAVDRIALATEGVPARIIRVCETALAEAARRGRKDVAEEIVDAAAVLVAAEMPKPIGATSAPKPLFQLFQPEPFTEPPIQPTGFEAAPSIGIVGDGYEPVRGTTMVRRRVRRRRIPLWGGVVLAAGVAGVGAVAMLGYVAGPNVPRPSSMPPAAETGDAAAAALESRPLPPPTVEPSHSSTESEPILAQPDTQNERLAESPRDSLHAPAADAQPTGLSEPASPEFVEKSTPAPAASPSPAPSAPEQTAPVPARELVVTARPPQAAKAGRDAPAAERPQRRNGHSRGNGNGGRDRERAEESTTVEAIESAPYGGDDTAEGRPRSVQELITMGDEFRDAGDTEWARRLYRAAQERGSAKAAIAEAETYDPQYAAASSRPNPDEARRLYSEAARQGDRAAAKRLEELDQWMSERSSR